MGTQLEFTVTTLVIGLPRGRWWCGDAGGPTSTCDETRTWIGSALPASDSGESPG
jgi:hypothetical protein